MGAPAIMRPRNTTAPYNYSDWGSLRYRRDLSAANTHSFVVFVDTSALSGNSCLSLVIYKQSSNGELTEPAEVRICYNERSRLDGDYSRGNFLAELRGRKSTSSPSA